METPEIIIPDGAYLAIKNLIALSSEDFEAFLRALSQSKPAVVPSVFCEHISEIIPQVDSNVIESIVDELFTMGQAREDWDISGAEFAKLLGEAALVKNSEKFPFTEEQKRILQTRVEQIFETKNALSLTAKALDVISGPIRAASRYGLSRGARKLWNVSLRHIRQNNLTFAMMVVWKLDSRRLLLYSEW